MDQEVRRQPEGRSNSILMLVFAISFRSYPFTPISALHVTGDLVFIFPSEVRASKVQST